METNTSMGWAGRILKINLTDQSIQIIPLDLDIAKKYLGGRGLNSYALYQLATSDIDEFGPDNPLIVGVGPLCGTLVPAASKVTFTTKSPLSNIFGDSTMGGYFGPQLKYAGYDQIIITGKSQKPVYVLIDDDHIEIKEADHTIWGTDTWTVQKEIKRRHGNEFEVACIGQAGENLVRYANIMHGLKRAAGKFGIGAVMGSKKLKAIAVRGTRGVNVAHPDLLRGFARKTQDEIIAHPFYKTRSVYGTPHLQNTLSPLGILSTRNFETTSFEHYEKIGGIRITEEYSTRMRSCMGCPAHCTHYYVMKEGPYKNSFGEGPEFTMTSMVGDRCGISDLEGLLKLNELTNQYGMDCAAFGGILGWAMDCYEKGIIDKTDTDGLELFFGNAKAAIELAHRIAKREGFGNILAEGERRAPEIIGRGSEKHMQHCKGGIIIAEEPRALQGFGLAYLTSTRGSDHLRARYPLETIGNGPEVAEKLFGNKDASNPRIPQGKGIGVKWFEDLMTVVDALGICKFNYPGFMDIVSTPDVLAEGYYVVTGVKLSGQELLKIGERIYNVEKAFNVRLGLSRKDDNFSNPEKFLKEPLKDGSFKGQVFHLDIMLDEYYQARGWDDNGLPTRKNLEILDLREIADDLMRLGKLGKSV